MQSKYGIDTSSSKLYQKSYQADFDYVPYPVGWHMPDFVKFNGEDNRITCEHISRYIAQLGEAGYYNTLRVCLFSLSLTGTAFAWYFFWLPALLIHGISS